MDFYTVKLKILNEIANANAQLSPRDTHVFGNWHTQSWEGQTANFPMVTVRMQGDLMPMWSRKTPTLNFAEMYGYDFSLFVFGSSMTASRDIADAIIDYFQQHNKFPETKIVEIINFTSKESVLQRGTRRYWRTIVTFKVVTEEELT